MKLRDSINRNHSTARFVVLVGMNRESELLMENCAVGILYLVLIVRLELRLSSIG